MVSIFINADVSYCAGNRLFTGKNKDSNEEQCKLFWIFLDIAFGSGGSS